MVPGVAASFTNSTTIGPPPQAVPASQLLRTNTAMAYSSRYNGTANYNNVRHNQYNGHHQQQHHRNMHYHCNDARYPMTSPTSLLSTPLDNNNFHGVTGSIGYYHVGHHTGSTSGSSVSPSLSSSSPPTPPSSSSSSSAAMPATYHRGRHQQHHVYAPTQTHDCHGVPAHPSVADYPSSPLAQYHHQQLPYYAPQQPVSSPPIPPHSHHHNNNNYLPSLSCELLEDIKSDKSAAGYK